MVTECCICGRDLSAEPMIRKVEMYQESKGTFYEDNVYELCPEHYAAIARVFESEE